MRRHEAICYHATVTIIVVLNCIIVTGLLVFLLYELRQHRKLKQRIAETSEKLTHIAYDLRSPLARIRKQLGFLGHADNGRLTARQRATVDAAIVALNDALTDVDRMLLTMRLDAARVAFHPSTVLLYEVARGAVAARRELAASRQQHITLRGNANVTSAGEPLLLHGILDELIGNALQYSNDGATVTVSVGQARRQATVQVQDTGIGTTPAERKRLFTPYFRGAKAKRLRKGEGLGLSLAGALAKLMKARIVAEANPEGGTLVTLQVPQAKRS